MTNLLVRRKMLTSMGVAVPYGTKYVVKDQETNSPVRIYATGNPTSALSDDGTISADSSGFVSFYALEGRAYKIVPVDSSGDLITSYDIQPGDLYDVKDTPATIDSQGRLLGPGGEVVLDPKQLTQAERTAHRFVNGVIETVQTPHPDRIKRLGGDSLFNFSTSTPAVTNGTAALNSSFAWRNRQSYALTANGAGNMSATWTTSLTAGSYDPTTHYVLAIYNGAGTTSGFSLSLDGAAGRSQSWSVSGSGFRPGWNLIFLCSATDMVARGSTTTVGYGNQSGVVNVSNPGGGGLLNQAITSISLSFFGPANGAVHYVDCIELSTIVKPMVCWTWDQAYNDTDTNTSVLNPFLNEVLPAFLQTGLSGGVRYHHAIDMAPAGLSNLNAALEQGWEVYNGTLTRATPVTIAADMYWQYAINQQQMTRRGLPFAMLASPAGNNTSSDNATGLSTFPNFGVPFSKGTSHSAIYQGVQGYGNPLSLGVTDFDGKSATEILALTDAAIACGTNLLAFSHFPKLAQTPAELLLALQGLKIRQEAGLIDVVGPNTFVRGMSGW